MKPVTWKQIDHRIGPVSHTAYVGKVPVGSVHYALTSKGQATAYSFQCNLPGLKNKTGDGPTVEEAKARVEKLIEVWFKEVD